jgi:hypothetical protein
MSPAWAFAVFVWAVMATFLAQVVLGGVRGYRRARKERRDRRY